MNFRKFLFVPLASLAAMMITSGCVKNELEELEAKEKQIISKYLSDNNISSDTKTEGGIYFIEKVAGTGLSPVRDNYVIVNYTGRYLEDGTIRETSYDSLKSEWPISPNLDYYLFGPVKILYGYSMPGINEALSLMKEGGRASAILPSDKANYDYRPLVYDLELLKVIRDPKRYEDSVATVFSDKYFSDTARLDTLNIWTRIDDAPLSDNTFEPGDTLIFNFTGLLIDAYGDSARADRIFDSNSGKDPVKYAYGQNKLSSGVMLYQNNLPKGLKVAIDSLTVTSGMKFSVLLGYDQAFGTTGLLHPTDKYIIIPVYQTVLYQIDVTAIRPE